MIRIVRIALAAAAIAAFPLSTRAQDLGLKVGEMAPPAMVETLTGTPVDLGQLYGSSPVVLEFWATWCPLCRKLEPAMEAARVKFAGRAKFVAVGVPSNQTAERQKAYVEQQKLSGEFVFDRNGAAMKAFQVPHTSYVVVIDRTGRVVYTGVGGDQDIEAALRKAFQ
jgi:peroxiredoxin